MHTHKVLYSGLTIVVLLVTLLLSATSLPTTAALRIHPAADPNAGWQEVGASSASGGGISNSGNAGRPSMAIAPDPDGTPYVAWADGSSGNSEIYVRRWNGGSWEEVGAGSASGGGISDNVGGSYSPSIAIAPDGTPYVAWHNYSSGDDRAIYVRRWNGSSWEEVGTGSASGGGISDNSGDSLIPSMAIAPDGTPYVAWEDHSGGDGEIYVRRWNGGSWEEVGAGSATGGGISNNSGDSEYPSVAIAPDGLPYVVWYDDSSWVTEVYTRRWNGSSWEEVGAGSASGGGISDVIGSLSHSSSMAMAQDSVDVPILSLSPPVVIAPDGTPYVAWAVCFSWFFFLCDHSEIYVRRWNGSGWGEVGSGSASGGGISDTSSRSDYSSVAIAPDGTPYVAWYDQDWVSFDDGEIYVRRWNGSSWEEVGAGSASGGGISDNSELSAYPSVAIAPDGAPYIAWLDWSDGDDGEIYVRRWEGGGATPPPPTATPTPPRNNAIYLPNVMKDYCSPDNYEPNSPCNQAWGRLIPDRTYQSYISCYDVAFGKNGEGERGYDYFFFRTDTTRDVTIVLDNTLADKDYDLYLYRYPDCENWIAESAGTSVVETISTSVGPGTYYVLVFSPFGQYSTNPYSLRMTSP